MVVHGTVSMQGLCKKEMRFVTRRLPERNSHVYGKVWMIGWVVSFRDAIFSFTVMECFAN